ncbi:thioredoxin family protein [Candidatus Hepatoplasma crinochetorum]|uniref:thioredoxin family protein n=1 Tax=Candidatus Hepatoplasma crinochetorum TaxID=295596 RepID=UPI003091D614|nr:MAG: thioredoxin [Candidatus Hepatoplasma crinochetorum]
MRSEISKSIIFNLREEIEKNEKPIFVYFFASWCGECKMSSLIFERLKEKYEGKILFFNINVDQEKLWISKENKFFQVEKVPTFMIFKNLKEIERYVNFQTINFHQNKIENYLNS